MKVKVMSMSEHYLVGGVRVCVCVVVVVVVGGGVFKSVRKLKSYNDRGKLVSE